MEFLTLTLLFICLTRYYYTVAAGENTKQNVAAAKTPYSSTQLANILPLQLVPTALHD